MVPFSVSSYAGHSSAQVQAELSSSSPTWSRLKWQTISLTRSGLQGNVQTPLSFGCVSFAAIFVSSHTSAERRAQGEPFLEDLFSLRPTQKLRLENVNSLVPLQIEEVFHLLRTYPAE
jgi:hypothetical protein